MKDKNTIIDKKTCSFYLEKILTKRFNIINKDDPIYLLKSIKNKIEIKNLRKKDNNLITTGLWSYLRHPNLVGLLLMFLGLHVLALSGVGSQWSTGSITRDEETYDILSIDSKIEEIIGFVKAGYPEKTREVRKKPVVDIVNYLD